MARFRVNSGKTWSDSGVSIYYETLGECGDPPVNWEMKVTLVFEGETESLQKCSNDFPVSFTMFDGKISVSFVAFGRDSITGDLSMAGK